jgi:hypothetical protein
LVHGTNCAELVPHDTGVMDKKMVFMTPAEFREPEQEVAALTLDIERVVFEKVKGASEHMKPLFIRGHLDGSPAGRMMVDGGTRVNIIPLVVFK